MQNNRRQNNRIASSLPIEIQIDKQITIEGKLKDISHRSAFVTMKNSVYMQVNDEFKFFIKTALQNPEDTVSGTARISRIAKGEGIAIFFTDMDEKSSASLQQLLGK